MSRLNVGLLSNTSVQQEQVALALKDCGADVVIKLLPHQCASFSSAEQTPVDAWVIELDFEQSAVDLDDWLEHLDAPIVFGDGAPLLSGSEGYSAWLVRMEKKLTQVLGEIHRDKHSESQVKNVCVLAASTGGPAAVKTFVDALPAGLDVAFVYVQHINQDYDQTLISMMSRDSHYPAYIASHGVVLRCGHLALIRPNEVLKVLENGTFSRSMDREWPGDYSPSIDQMIANLSQIYRDRAGAIVFTGMGEDGLLGCRLLKQQGGYVWAQTPQSCVSDSMPQAVLAADLATFSAEPEQLAKQLNRHLSSAMLSLQ